MHLEINFSLSLGFHLQINYKIQHFNFINIVQQTRIIIINASIFHTVVFDFRESFSCSFITFLDFFMRKSFSRGFFFPYNFLQPNIVIRNHISLDTLHANEARIIPLKCSNYKSKELKKYLMVLTINLRINSNTYKLLFTYINSKEFITNSYGVDGGFNLI